jgi:hypothetical protein
MKIRSKLFSDLPINSLVIPLLLVFFMQAALIMFYNSNNLTFPSLSVFHSLSKAAAIADANFTSLPQGIPSLKEANGFLYPALASIFYKIAGKYNMITVIYVISFFVFLLAAVLFYKLAAGFINKETAVAASAVFITAPPVVLAMFSGGDVILACLLLALNAYFVFYHVPAGKYTGAWATAVLLCLVNFSGLMFGAASAAYLVLRLNEKTARKYYRTSVLVFFGIMLAVLSAIAVYIFGEKISVSFMEQSALFDTKTFQVDSFFKDGFLWSKALPPFFAALFCIAFFMKLGGEIKNKKAGFVIYSAAVTLAAFLMEFFSTFSAGADTVLFVTPFYIIMVLFGVSGASDISIYLQQKKTRVFNSREIFYGIITLVIFVNLLFLFNKSVERNNVIKNIAGSTYVEKFTER